MARGSLYSLDTDEREARGPLLFISKGVRHGALCSLTRKREARVSLSSLSKGERLGVHYSLYLEEKERLGVVYSLDTEKKEGPPYIEDREARALYILSI